MFYLKTLIYDKFSVAAISRGDGSAFGATAAVNGAASDLPTLATGIGGGSVRHFRVTRL